MDACVPLVVQLIYSFLILYFCITPHTHLNTTSHSSLSLLPVFCCCPGLCSTQHCWSDDCFVDLPIQLHWHFPIAQHTSAFVPISPRCIHSQCDLRVHASFLHAAFTISVIYVSMPHFPRCIHSQLGLRVHASFPHAAFTLILVYVSMPHFPRCIHSQRDLRVHASFLHAAFTLSVIYVSMPHFPRCIHSQRDLRVHA